MAEVPQVEDVPETAEVPQMAVLPFTKTEVPQIAEVPQMADVPQIAESAVGPNVTVLLLALYVALGERAVPVNKSEFSSAAGIFR